MHVVGRMVFLFAETLSYNSCRKSASLSLPEGAIGFKKEVIHVEVVRKIIQFKAC